MSMFGQIAGQLGTALAGTEGKGASLAGVVLEMLGKGELGGLSGLIQAFQAKGLGEIVGSWVSTGSNLPISPGQIQAVLGEAGIQQLAQKVGLSPEAASSELASILPMAVDTLTPEGTVPEGGALEQALSLLKGTLR